MKHIRRRIAPVVLALMAALTLALSTPVPAFAGPDRERTEVFPNDGRSGRRCSAQCGW